MADNVKQVGMYWGDHSLYIVETEALHPKHILSIPIPGEQNNVSEEDIPKQLQLISAIQNAFRSQGIDTSIINLALPPKDIIFRCFTVPRMATHEIKSVVEYEINKYIPFTLEELSYSFHPIPVTEENTKRFRIVFVAIKKDTLEQYTNLFEQAKLNVFFIEPAPLSFVRILSTKKLLPLNDTTSVIEKEQSSVKITIIDQGIPHFVREFTLPSQQDEDTSVQTSKNLTRLINELKISFDYFSRQFNNATIKQTLLFSDKDLNELSKTLQDNLNIPVTTISGEKIFNTSEYNEPGFIKAFGASIAQQVETIADFNLATKKPEAAKIKAPKQQKRVNWKSVIAVMLICIPLIILGVFLGKIIVSADQKKLLELNTELGAFQSASTMKLQEKKASLETKLKNYKRYRTQSNFAYLLDTLPEHLPEGTWIKNLNIYYSRQLGAVDKSVKNPFGLTIDLSGYAYLENKNEQFGLVNRFLQNLKASDIYNNIFDTITLGTLNQKFIGDFQTTSFQVKFN